VLGSGIFANGDSTVANGLHVAGCIIYASGHAQQLLKAAAVQRISGGVVYLTIV
jgi:hypothetical protein